MDYKSRLKTAGIYVLAVAISLLALGLVLQLWNAHLSVPLAYDGDATGDELFNGMLIKGIIDNGWYLSNGYLGAPTGLDLFDFPMVDNLHFLLIRCISLFAGSWPATMNIFYLATFPLAVITSLFVFRRLHVSTPVAMVGSVLFAFLPYHFERGEQHLFLAGIYIIPLSCLMVLRICTGASPFLRQDDGGENYDFRSRRTLGYVIIALLTACAGIYYALFACFFLVVAGVYSSYTQRSVKRLAVAVVAISLIGIGIFINISPNVIYSQKNGKNQAVAVRSPNETAVHALALTPMIFPVWGHRIGLFDRLTTHSISKAPSVPWASSLGLIGASGLLFLLGWLILAKGREANMKKRFFPLIDSLSVLSISAILLAVSGGAGLFFAIVISPQLRAYYRIGIFIGFFSILAVLLVLEILRRKYVRTNIHEAVFFGILFVILVGGILDQVSYKLVPDYAMSQEEFSRDEAFIDEIESALPESALVFQLPYLPFPESTKVNNMNDYNHLRGYLHSDLLRWSYPTMKGRYGDVWIQEISGKPAEQMVRELADAGFQGIYINRNGYQDGGVEIEQQLAAELHVIPMVNDDGTLAFYDMTEYKNK